MAKQKKPEVKPAEPGEFACPRCGGGDVVITRQQCRPDVVEIHFMCPTCAYTAQQDLPVIEAVADDVPQVLPVAEAALDGDELPE